MGIAVFFRTWFRGRLAGEDAEGNRYYEDRKAMRYGRPRRWVLYKGRAEASKVPAGWHGWLHYVTPEPPKFRKPCFWEKEHLPNLTGTPLAHRPRRPSGKESQGIAPEKGYEAWTPTETPPTGR